MRTWPQDGSSNSTETSQRQAYDVIAAEYGDGANGPFTIVVDTAEADPAAVAAQVAGTPGIVGVTTPFTTPTARSASSRRSRRSAPPTSAPPSWSTTSAPTLPDGVEVTGLDAAVRRPLRDPARPALWLVVGFVVAVSVLLLAMMFRSIVVPVKAAAMNLLSIGAAYGVLTAGLPARLGQRACSGSTTRCRSRAGSRS